MANLSKQEILDELSTGKQRATGVVAQTAFDTEVYEMVRKLDDDCQNLAMLLRRVLAYPTSITQQTRALEYLRLHGFLGSPLRES